TEHALRSGTFSPTDGSLPGQVQRHGLVGHEIAGAHLGLLGAGAIGQAVAEKALALGMRVYAVDPFLPKEVFDSAGIIKVDTVEELLPKIDVLSVHVPGGNAPVITAEHLTLLPEH